MHLKLTEHREYIPEYEKFKKECRKLCESRELEKYCTRYFSGDRNENGKEHEIVRVGNLFWPACEDRVYCFLVAPCENLGEEGIGAIRECRDIVCAGMLERYKNLPEEERYRLCNTRYEKFIPALGELHAPWKG